MSGTENMVNGGDCRVRITFESVQKQYIGQICGGEQMLG